MREYESYIFDLDGTIIKSMDVWMQVFRGAIVHFGIEGVDDDKLVSFAHDWTNLTTVGFPKDRLSEFSQHVYKSIDVHLSSVNFFEDSLDVLQNLNDRGKKLAICSSMDRPIFDTVMQQGNLYKLIPVAVAGTDVPFRKPHPAGLLKAMDDLNLSDSDRSAAVYVGDRHTDIQAAKNAGIDSVLFYPEEHREMYKYEDLKKDNPTHVISDWPSLIVT